MQLNMHCNVAGKLFAAVIDLQKIDINFAFKAAFAGLTLDSGGTASVAKVPAKCIMIKPCQYTSPISFEKENGLHPSKTELFSPSS